MMKKYTNKQIAKIEESAKKRSKDLVHITDKKGFSAEDRIKLGLCKHFVQFLVANEMSLKDMAALMEIPTTRLSEITNYKFQKYTVDKLLHYLEILAKHDASVKEYLKLFSQIAEIRVPTVAQSRKLYKTVEQTMSF